VKIAALLNIGRFDMSIVLDDAREEATIEGDTNN
jgi:hypothetical protein